MVEPNKTASVATNQETEGQKEDAVTLAEAKLPKFMAPKDFFVNATHLPALQEMQQEDSPIDESLLREMQAWDELGNKTIGQEE